MVDGYSLLHAWPELAQGKPRFSAAAREELAHCLTQYQDAIGVPITLVFDGQGTARSNPATPVSRKLEVIFSKSGQTADDIIERATYLLSSYGQVLVVTDDLAEKDTVTSVGGVTSSCENFIRDIQNTLKELHRDIQLHNRREMSRYKK